MDLRSLVRMSEDSSAQVVAGSGFAAIVLGRSEFPLKGAPLVATHFRDGPVDHKGSPWHVAGVAEHVRIAEGGAEARVGEVPMEVRWLLRLVASMRRQGRARQ